MPINHDVLRNLLEGSGFVKQTDLDDAFKVSAHLGCDVSDVLLGRNLISEDNYGQILATYYNISFINLDKIEIPHSVINQIPEDLAAEKMAIVFENKDGVLGVAMQDPQDLETIEMIRKTVGSGYQLVIYVATSTALKNALKAYKERTASVQTDDVMKVDDTNLSAIALVENFLDYAVREEASDIHIEPIPEHLLVRIRVDGVLQDHKVFPIKLHSPITARIKILSDLKIDEHRIPQDGRHKFNIDEEAIALRISIIPGFYGENVVMRLLVLTQKVDKNDSILGFFHRWIEEFAKHSEHVIVVTLEEGKHDLPKNVSVYSLGKEKGASKVKILFTFYLLVFNLRHRYDAVFVHMNPEYVVLGGLLWRLLGKRVSLWYTHKSVDLKLRVAKLFANIIFTASKESFRVQTNKLHVVGHGIDTDFFSPDLNVARGDWYLSVGRLMPSKDHRMAIVEAKNDGKKLRIAGAGPELKDLEAFAHSLGAQVEFLGGMTQGALRDEYRKAALLIHT
ncbi:MAG: Type II secretory pathway, ATPase PulE/Tfp pilus assembly pathway, ATPase PilB, partial [Candidatus Woesebacteria bacterium GW2011_GWA1_38_8]